MDKENLFTFPLNIPYDNFPESDTDEEDIIAGITRRFSHFFSSSPESTLRLSSFNHSLAPSPPLPPLPPSPLVNGEEDAWNLLCEVARMKMKASNFPAEEYFRQREYSGGGSLRECVGGPPQVHRKIGGGVTAKRECAGTGVFLPRGYFGNNNNHPLPESRKRQACSPANLPPRMMNQSTNKTFVPITSRPEIQARIDVGSIPNYEMLMSRRNALILAAQQQHRSNMHRGVMESTMSNNINPEVLLPQEWTY